MRPVIHATQFLLVTLAVAGSVRGVAEAAHAAGWLEVLGLTVTGVVRGAFVLSWLGAAAALFLAADLAGWGLRWRAYEEADKAAPAGDLTAALAGLAPRLGLTPVPQLQVYESPVANCCAVGWRPGKSHVAVSTGLLQTLGPEAATAVLAQALAKLANGDTAALIALGGLIAPFSFFPARLLAGLLGTSLRTAEEETPSDPLEVAVVGALEILLTPVASLLVRRFCRTAERLADRRAAGVLGGAALRRALGEAGAGTAAHRDRFTQPLLFGAPVRPRLPGLAWHGAPSRRIDALASSP